VEEALVAYPCGHNVVLHNLDSKEQEVCFARDDYDAGADTFHTDSTRDCRFSSEIIWYLGHVPGTKPVIHTITQFGTADSFEIGD